MLLALLGNGVEKYYADAGVTLSVSASTVNVGDEVSVTVSIPNDYSATIDLVFLSIGATLEKWQNFPIVPHVL